MKFLLPILFVIVNFTLVFSESLNLVNDSPYTLTAEVQAPNGLVLGDITLAPNEQSQWSTDMSRTYLDVPQDANFSLTPFRVVWKCQTSGYYSVCEAVSPGATIAANTCSGSKTCLPKPPKQKEPKCPPCPTCPECPKCPECK